MLGSCYFRGVLLCPKGPATLAPYASAGVTGNVLCFSRFTHCRNTFSFRSVFSHMLSSAVIIGKDFRMPPQSAASDDWVIILMLFLAIGVFVILLIAAFLLLRFADKARNEPPAEHEFTFRIPSALTGKSTPRERPTIKPDPGPPDPSPAPIASVDRLRSLMEFIRRNLFFLGGIPLMTALMLGINLGLLIPYSLARPLIDFGPQILIFIFSMISAAAGGAIGIRVGSFPWRNTVLPALLSGTALIALERLGFLSLPALWFGTRITGTTFDIGAVLRFLPLLSAGVFLLPIFDPIVRKIGPAPSPWKVALAALPVAIVVIRMYGYSSFLFWSVQLPPDFPLNVACTVIAIGILLSLFRQDKAGAWLGALGLMLLPLYGIGTLWILASYGS